MSGVVPVELGERAYPVVIDRNGLAQLGDHLRPLLGKGRLAVVMDRNVEVSVGSVLSAGLARAGIAWDALVIEPGEQTKSFAGLEALCDRLLALNLDRGDLILAFGGGVVGDLTGFAAAIYKRGISMVQVPTTLLAQVDSSVGGKTAIDTPRGKNLIGAFHQPKLVVIDSAVLDSLPQRELVCGLAEVLKYGLLGDPVFFHWLVENTPAILRRDAHALDWAITRSVQMKAAIVARDEREGGARALLNLGHTFGHAVEAETGFGEVVKHGEAVGLGCGMAFRFSASFGVCAPSDAEVAVNAIAAAGLPTRLSDVCETPFRADALMRHMVQDKKASGGKPTLVLARAIGDSFVERNVDPARLQAFLEEEGATP